MSDEDVDAFIARGEQRKRAAIAAQFGLALDAVRLDDTVPFKPLELRYFGMPRWWVAPDGTWRDDAAVPQDPDFAGWPSAAWHAAHPEGLD